MCQRGEGMSLLLNLDDNLSQWKKGGGGGWPLHSITLRGVIRGKGLKKDIDGQSDHIG